MPVARGAGPAAEGRLRPAAVCGESRTFQSLSDLSIISPVNVISGTGVSGVFSVNRVINAALI